MKLLLQPLSLILLFSILLSIGCEKSDMCDITCPTGEVLNSDCECELIINEETEELLPLLIKEDMTLTSDKIYILQGKTYVTPGVELTIMPGTIVKGTEGAGSLASALVITRGAKINACGTPKEPIIFTSILDNIEIGQTLGTNLGKEDREKWGGLVVLGNAPISASDGDTETQIEGIPGDVEYGKYGGENVEDNSGKLCYISIRHGGALIGDDNEINGLTLGGVGNGTYIDHIEVVANLDDGVEFFGGTVDASNIIVSYQGDDAIDIDMNYSGTVSNGYIIHGGSDTDEAFEIDGPENSTYTEGKFIVENFTVVAVDQELTSGADFKSGAQGTMRNISFEGYAPGKVMKLRASFNIENNCSDKIDAYTNYVSGDLVISGVEYISSSASIRDIASVYIDSKATDANDLATCLDNSGYVGDLSNSIGSNNSVKETATVGADLSVFDWTWTAQNGLILE